MARLWRPAHILKTIKSLVIPRNYIILDTETREIRLANGDRQQELKLGWAVYYRYPYGRHIYREQWIEFRDGLSIWQFIYKHLERKQLLWVLARNLPFDFTVIDGWYFLRQAGFKIKFIYNSGITNIISVTGPYGSIIFLDVLNWFRESLSATGQRLKIPKLKIDFATADDKFLSIYCKRDVEIELANWKQFIEFIRYHGLCSLSYTIGSTAYHTYLHRFYKHKIYIHNDVKATDLERESYRGGRIECYRIGKQEYNSYYVLDVNSLYPYVMQQELYPVKYLHYLPRMSLKELRFIVKNYAVIADVYVDTKEPVYAIKRDYVIFPVGQFWTVLTTPEIIYGLKHRHIKQIRDIVIYERADIFSDYVSFLYKMRLEFKQAGVTEYEHICKLLLNSLYGKFAQKAEQWVKIGEAMGEPDRLEEIVYADNHKRRQLRYLLGEVFELKGFGEAFNSFPAISSHVTANGRLYLWNLIKTAGIENCFYCDTDSLIVNVAGYDNLSKWLHPTELGKLKLVESSTLLDIKAAKDYETDKGKVIKGIRSSAVQLADNVYEQEKWSSFKGIFRQADYNTYVISSVTKTLHREYHKGVVTASGIVRPFVLAESLDRRKQGGFAWS